MQDSKESTVIGTLEVTPEVIKKKKTRVKKDMPIHPEAKITHELPKSVAEMFKRNPD